MTIPANKVDEFRRRIGIVCNCASIPPTMPTCRDYHLPDCPIAISEANQRLLTEVRELLATVEGREKLAVDMARESFVAEHGQAAYDELREAFEGEAA